MAKQSGDTETIDMLPPAKRGRGRPATGNAKTPAERQRARRARMAEAGLKTVTMVLPVDAVDGLTNFVRFKDVTPGAVVGKLITGQLLRKRNGSRGAK